MSHVYLILHQLMVARSADAHGEGPRAGSSDVHEVRIGADLVEDGQETLGFGEKSMVHVRLELTQRIVDAEAIVFDAPLEQDEVTLLPGKAFEDLHELVGRGVQRVIESGLVHFRATFVAKRFLAEIGDALLNVEVRNREILQIGGKLENLLAHRCADFKRLRIGIFFQLANLERGFPLFTDLDLDEFGRAAFEYAPVRDGRVAGSRLSKRSEGQRSQQKKQEPGLGRVPCHSKTQMRETAPRLRVPREVVPETRFAAITRAAPASMRARN